MREERADALTFGRDSPVRTYWLTRCVGFELVSRRGDVLGTVRSVDEAGADVSLACRYRGREVRLPADAVDAVAPQERRLYIAPDAGPASSAKDGAPLQERPHRALRSLSDRAAPLILATRRRTAATLVRMANAVAPTDPNDVDGVREDDMPTADEQETLDPDDDTPPRGFRS